MDRAKRGILRCMTDHETIDVFAKGGRMVHATLSGALDRLKFLVGIDDDARAMAAVAGQGYTDPEIVGHLDAAACRQWKLLPREVRNIAPGEPVLPPSGA